MYFLFSGEGATDLGSGRSGAGVEEHIAGHFDPGPVAHLIDQIVAEAKGFSPLETLHCGFVTEKALADRKRDLNWSKKSLVLPGVKRPRETIYFYNDARVLARIAQEKASGLDDIEPKVVAVLFRDADGTASAGRGNWPDKYQSMIRGFATVGWRYGVAVLANPKSEAWWLCATQDHPYQNCHQLEEASGNNRSPNNLKAVLEAKLGCPANRETLCELVRTKAIDHARIDMPSFHAFRERLIKVIGLATRTKMP